VYLPYAWTDEYYDLRSEDALAIKRDVIDNQSLAQEVRQVLYLLLSTNHLRVLIVFGCD
jgi:hypothetical protein